MSFIQMGMYFTAGSAILLIIALIVRRIPLHTVLGSLAIATMVLFVLTAIFDNVMISAGLFDYGQHQLVGVRVGLAPVEDFLYPLCAVMFMPALWWLFGGRKPGRAKQERE